MDSEQEPFKLPAPFLQPRLLYTCPTVYEAGYQPVTAVEAGIPTAPTTTPNLTQAERRKRFIVYMVRYNRLEVWMKANISNVDASKEQLELEFEYCDTTRKEL
jgi:hypothetical protein